MRQKLIFPTLLILASFACSSTLTPLPAGTRPPTNIVSSPTNTFTPPAATATQTISVTPTDASTETPIPSETPLPSNTPLPTVESLEATVTADRLSCRYGPGPEYLYLFAFRAAADIQLIGRVDAENWDWVLVENEVPCWVKASFLQVQGDIKSLPVVYPGVAKLPKPNPPYYSSSAVLGAKRNNETNEITLYWVDVPVSPGDYANENMQTYIIELWRCQDGQLIFDPVGTRLAYMIFVDEPGCSEPSHGRVWVQDKHGYAGPAEIPWPEYP